MWEMGMKIGQCGILNVGTGDTKLSFDKENPAERIRAARIVADMIRRGYALLVEVERNGVKAFQRVEKFDEEKCEYVIADFDPVAAQQADSEEVSHEETQVEEPRIAKPKLKAKPGRRAIKAESARAISVPRRAGG
jgi:hypothetical protein